MQEVVRKLEEEIASIQTQLAVKRCNVITSSVGGLPESKHLDGTSYSDWKFAMKNYLMDSGLWQCFMRSDVNEELSQRALAKINLSIKPCAWAEVGKAKTAKETREGLRYAYQDKGIVRRIGLYSSLFKTRFENCHSTTNYSNRIASTAEQLEAVGKPLDDETASRLDICHAVRVVSSTGKAHWIAVKRIVRYLKATKNMKLVYKRAEGSLTAYCNADWANDTTGFVVCLPGTAVSWNFKKQRTVALSTAEAEYVALSHTMQEITWLQSQCIEL
ncbi:hypothetical protein D918_04766 [Trichuris suis]|nr:hypothetical protein D918_04766 [Trichuris suis]